MVPPEKHFGSVFPPSSCEPVRLFIYLLYVQWLTYIKMDKAFNNPIFPLKSALLWEGDWTRSLLPTLCLHVVDIPQMSSVSVWDPDPSSMFWPWIQFQPPTSLLLCLLPPWLIFKSTGNPFLVSLGRCFSSSTLALSPFPPLVARPTFPPEFSSTKEQLGRAVVGT